jgi:arylsulfatase
MSAATGPAFLLGEGGLGRPNILLIDIDSLRADRIAARRDGALVAPRLSSLAEDGVRFEQAFSSAGWTVPALQSLLTGRYPVLEAGDGGPGPVSAVHPEGARTLPEVLGYYGYEGRAFWGSTMPRRLPVFQRGFAQGGDATLGSETTLGAELDAWLASDPEEPFFVLVHEVDLHQPHGLLGREQEPGLEAVYRDLMGSSGEEAARREVERLYDAYLSAYDTRIGTLLDALEQRGLREDTLIVLTSNHGEELGEAGTVGHTGGYRDALLRVPLVLVHPDLPSGRIVGSPVQSLDLAPTLLDLAGLPQDVTMDGVSLLPLLRDEPLSTARDGLFFTNMPGEGALRENLLTLVRRNVPIHTPGRPNACTWHQLHDLAEDPLGQRDICPEYLPLALEMAPRLEGFLDERSLLAKGLRSPMLDEGTRRLMQERGYWSAAPHSQGSDAGGEGASAPAGGDGQGGDPHPP